MAGLLNYFFKWAKLRISDGVGGQPRAECWYSLVTLFRYMDVHGCTCMYMYVQMT